MKKLAHFRPTTVTVLAAAVLLVVAGGGGAVAGSLITSAQIKNNTIQSVDVKNNALTGTDIANNSLGAADIKDGSLTNQDVSIYFARVKADGTLVGSSGGVTTDEIGSGHYSVKFPRDVTKCAFTGSVASLINDIEEGQLTTANLSGSANGVFVLTQSDTGTDVDLPFHLIVVC